MDAHVYFYHTIKVKLLGEDVSEEMAPKKKKKEN